MRNIIYALLIFAVAGSITGCANAPVYNVEQHPLPIEAKRLTDQEIGQRISQAVSRRDWNCVRTCPKTLICHLDKRTHKAVVQVDYNHEYFSINYVKSTNLKYEGGNIHPKYNQWIRNMEGDIVKAIHQKPCCE
jgi:hypothetical protein